MPPKQATLGKFFGLRDGVSPKKQQSTLAFKSSSKPDKKTEEHAEAVKTEKKVKAEVEDLGATNGGNEDLESLAGEEIEEQKDIKAESSSIDVADEESEMKSSGSKRKSPPPPDEDEDEDEEPVKKRARKGRPPKCEKAVPSKDKGTKSTPRAKKASRKDASVATEEESPKKPPKKQQPSTPQKEPEDPASEDELSDEEDRDEKPETVKKARETIQTALKSGGKDPYLDWKPGEPVPYAALCTTFSLIEMTTKRLQIMAHCSLFLRQILRLTPDDLLPTIHLMTNKLAADYAGIELGIGESLIMKAVGEATGRSLSVIKQDQNEIGDLGLVAAKSRSTQPTMFKPKPLTVRSVFNSLMGIATVQTGGGAQQRKVDGIKKLLSAADVANTGKGSKGIDITQDKGGPSEAKFIVRALEGKLRLGLAEKTVPVALAQAMVVHESEKSGKPPSSEKLTEGEEIVKTVYSELPNYDVIVPAMLEHGIFNLKDNCKLQPGVPLKPMLAKPTKSITEVLDRFEGKNFTCEYKYDGERAQIHYVAKDSPQQYGGNNPALKKDATPTGISAIFSRNSEDLSKKYPDILAKLNTWIKPETKSFVLDCETVGWDVEQKKVLPFQQLMTRKRKDVKVEDVKVKVCVFAFDLLFHNGEAIVRLPLRERRSILHSAFTEVPGEFAFAQHGDTSDIDSIQTLLDESVKASCEGLMVKMLDTSESGYEPSKRSRNWLKVKKDYLSSTGDSLDLVVLGAYYGKGKRTSVYGAFLLASWNESTESFESVCNIGTGFSEAVLDALHEDLSQLVIDKPKPFYTHSSVPKDQPDVWFEARRVWEVKSADLTLSPRYKAGAAELRDGGGKGVSLRFPRYIRGREDKGPEQATASSMVVEMYRMQESVGKGKGGGVDDDFEY